MAIEYIPYDELFAHEYQLTYISPHGNISVGPYTYNVFADYTVTERQQIFQVCEKFLPWKVSDEQEHWERTMYMYQWIIKSPPPFPHSQYSLDVNIVTTIKRVYSGNINSEIAYIVEFAANSKVTLTKTDSSLLDNQTKLDNDLITKMVDKKTTPIFLHKNKNGTVAVATGQKPIVWPENEKEG